MSQKQTPINLKLIFLVVTYIFFPFISFDNFHVCQILGQKIIFYLEVLEFIRPLSLMGLWDWIQYLVRQSVRMSTLKIE